MLATGLFVGFYLLRADLSRRQIHANAKVIILVIGITGFVTSKLYKLIDTPSVFLAHPSLLLSPQGFTFYGAVIGGVVAAFLLAMYYKISILTLLDAVSPGAALGYGIGRIGCLLAGDGDYGVPTSLPWGMRFPNGIVPTTVPMHPTPIYEFIGAAIIAWFLWRLGASLLKKKAPAGLVFAQYLIWTGIARFFVEFIRRNPHVALGLTNAQIIAIFSVLSGGILWAGVSWRSGSASAKSFQES